MSALVPGTLFGAALALGGILVWQALAPVPPIEVPPASKMVHAKAEAPPLPVYEPPPEERFAVINARSLFDPARQPVAEPPQAGAQSLAPPELSLVGVAIGPVNSLAVLKRPDARPALTAKVGQTVDGWQLVRIAPGFVVFRANMTDYTVKLRAAAGLPQPVLGNAAGAAPPPNQ